MATYILFLHTARAHSRAVPGRRSHPKLAICDPNGPKLEPAWMGAGRGRAIQIAKGPGDNTMMSHDGAKAN